MQTRTIRRPNPIAWILLCGVPAWTGCAQSEYLAQLAIGQLGVFVRSVPIEDALQSGTLSDEQEQKLRLIVEAREFARNELNLNVGWAFSLFHDTQGQPLAYNLSAAPKDSLLAKSWTFPVVGEIDYIGFFNRDQAERAEADLQQQGYDTVLRSVDAYSTLGFLPDPVHSPLLNRGDADLVEVVIHELAHNTIYANGRSDFNESLATFIGRQGAVAFYERQGAEGLPAVELLRARYADQDRINAWFVELFDALSTHYAQSLSYDEQVATREAVFQAARDRFADELTPLLNEPDRYAGWGRLPTNNAWVLLNRRYNFDLTVFETAYEQLAGDFPAFVATLEAAADSPEPWAYLRQTTGTD